MTIFRFTSGTLGVVLFALCCCLAGSARPQMNCADSDTSTETTTDKSSSVLDRPAEFSMLEYSAAQLDDDEWAELLELVEPQALTIAEERLDLDDPQIVAGTIALAAMSQQLVFAYKLIDAGGDIHQILLDERGRKLPSDQLIVEDDLALALRGKIHPDLEVVLRDAPADEPISVLIWCRVPEWIPLPERRDPEERIDATYSDKLLQELDVVAELRNLVHTVPVAEELEAYGVAPDIADDAPLIHAVLTPEMIAAIANHEDVLEIYFDSINEPQINIARKVIRADIVHNRGITGSGVPVAVVEVGGRVNTNNPWLTLSEHNLAHSCLDHHAAMVAGVTASRHGGHRGIAPFSQVWMGGTCTGHESKMLNRLAAARKWGARVINNSWGYNNSTRIPNAMARYTDNLTFVHWRTVVTSAGNRGRFSIPNVTNPAINFNGIAVGAFYDRNTVQLSDDVMDGNSSYLNPVSTYHDRQKPEVVAPGTKIRTLINSWPWVTNAPGPSGTSLASPAVAGTAALLMQRAPALAYWPESVKAILMATAMHNLEGAARLSNMDGAGGIQAHRADDVARGLRGGWGGINYGCARPFITDLRKVYLRAGKRTRIAIAWNNNTNYSAYPSRPSADLDLQILAPKGTVAVGSYSWDNTFEIVDFVPNTTGYYTIRVLKFRCDLTPGWLGYAWYQIP